jgi:phosphosulfolactate synthase (CoM biosynthesis protein A)
LWTLASKLFGDLKQILPDRGVLAYKSQGLALVDKAGDYWDFIKVGAGEIPLHDRKLSI